MKIAGTITTRHTRPVCVAAAIRADNLRDMETMAEGETVVTTIRGRRIRSIIASVDDYLTNIGVADKLCSEPGQDE
jgi:hypothetical protein